MNLVRSVYLHSFKKILAYKRFFVLIYFILADSEISFFANVYCWVSKVDFLKIIEYNFGYSDFHMLTYVPFSINGKSGMEWMCM